jgi:hypothetical protein
MITKEMQTKMMIDRNFFKNINWQIRSYR